MLAKNIFVSANITNLPSPAKMKFADTLPRKNLPRRVPWEFHTWFSVSKPDHGSENIRTSQKKPRDMREEGSQKKGTIEWKVEKETLTWTPSPQPAYTFPFLSICIPSGMPASTYANTRLFKKVWLSGSTSNAYLCISQRARGSGERNIVRFL